MGMLSADTEIMMTVRLINAEYQGSHALLCHSYVATLVKSLSSCVGQITKLFRPYNLMFHIVVFI